MIQIIFLKKRFRFNNGTGGSKMVHKKLICRLCVCLLLLGVVSVSGCVPKQREVAKEEAVKEEVEKKEEEKDQKKDDDDIIVAGSVDTSSKFSFSVEEAIVGISYDEVPIVVMVGTFTNNSDETISFSWALEATAMQDGYTLPTAYLSGSGDFNYNDIAPGSTIPVFIGWEVSDGQNDITLTVVDSQHYAKEEIYAQTFTIDELIENTENYQNSDDVIGEPL